MLYNKDMENLESLARQIDAAVSIAATDALQEPGGSDLLDFVHDPNQMESTVHVEALLRYPDARAAIRLVTADTRVFLATFLAGEKEFEPILEEIESLGA